METSLARNPMSDKECEIHERLIRAVRAANGRTPTNHRLVLDGVFWIAQTGSRYGDKSGMLRLAVDRKLYLLRNAIERSFNKLKEARRGATSYLKTSESFLGFTDFTSIHFWLRHLAT